MRFNRLANDTTSFVGSISAKGRKASGDGGSVETSGKKILTVADTASVNTTAHTRHLLKGVKYF